MRKHEKILDTQPSSLMLSDIKAAIDGALKKYGDIAVKSIGSTPYFNDEQKYLVYAEDVTIPIRKVDEKEKEALDAVPVSRAQAMNEMKCFEQFLADNTKMDHDMKIEVLYNLLVLMGSMRLLDKDLNVSLGEFVIRELSLSWI